MAAAAWGLALALVLTLAIPHAAADGENVGIGADVDVVVERAQPQPRVIEGVSFAMLIASIASSLIIGFFAGMAFIKIVRPRTWYKYDKQAGGRGGDGIG